MDDKRLDALLSDYAEAARAEPSAEALASVLPDLQSRIASGDAGPPIDLPAGAVRPVRWLWPAGAGAAGVAAVIAWMLAAAPPSTTELPRPPDVEPVQDPAPSPTVVEPSAQSAAPVLPAPQPAPETNSGAPPTVPTPEVRRRPSLPKKVRAPTLAEEVNLVARMQAKLRTQDPKSALALVGTHRRQFPSGVLVDERRLVEAQALCRLGKHVQARRKIAQFVSERGKSPLLAAVREACPKPPPAETDPPRGGQESDK